MSSAASTTHSSTQVATICCWYYPTGTALVLCWYYPVCYYLLFMFICYYATPTIVLTASYSRVFCALSPTGSSRLNGDRSRELESARTRMLADRKSLAWMLLTIAVLHLVFEGPLFIACLCISMGHRLSRDPVFTLLLVHFAPMLSGVFNPFIYSLRAATFRRVVVRGNGSQRHGSQLPVTSGQRSRRWSVPAMVANNNKTRSVGVARHGSLMRLGSVVFSHRHPPTNHRQVCADPWSRDESSSAPRKLVVRNTRMEY